MRRDDPWHLLRILKIAVAAEDAELAADARAALRKLRPEMPAPTQGKARWRKPVRADAVEAS